MKSIIIRYYLLLIALWALTSMQGRAQFDYPVRKDISFGGKLVDMQKRFTAYISKTGNPYLIEARRLSLEGMVLNDKMDNRPAIINYIKAELLLIKKLPDSEIKDLLLADILQNKGRTYHYLGAGRQARAFVEESKSINEKLIRSTDKEVVRFAYFLLATNYDMLEGIMPIHFGIPGRPFAYTAIHIKKDILNIRGAEMGRSYWNLAATFYHSPVHDRYKNDTLIMFSTLAEEEFRIDKNMDRLYNGEFISTNKVMLADQYMNVYHDVNLCKLYTEKAIACLSINKRYKFPDAIPAFIDHEEMMRSSRPLSVFMWYIYNKTLDKRYLKLALDMLDSAVAALTDLSAETFVQGGRNIAEMNTTNRFVINILATQQSFPVKDRACLALLAEIEKAKTFNYQKKLLENQIARNTQNGGIEIHAIRKLTSQYQSLEENRLIMKHTDYLEQNLHLLSRIDSLEKSSYKNQILNDVFLKDEKPEISEICSNIKPGTTILSYYCDDFANLCIALSSSGITIYNMEFSNEFKNDLAAFQVMTSRQTMFDENWCRLSNKIYKGIVERYLDKANTRDLVIIPSGSLNCIPFESLVTSWSKDNKGKFNVGYLMQEINIRYEYSLKPFYKAELPAQITGLEKVYAFAPRYEIPSTTSRVRMAIYKSGNYMKSNLRSESFPLKYNVPEAETVAESEGGLAFINDDATEKTFRKVAPNADILHLSMHSYSFNNDPMYWGLVFSNKQSNDTIVAENTDTLSWVNDGILYAYEIYSMNLKADMVVLSACETGIGRYETGEGTRSLGLAFRYAGCNNTVMSLWAVDDEYTSTLMRSFYSYLKQGKPKSEALSFAKRDFVVNNKTAGPFFWAGFILYGDNEPVKLKNITHRFSIFLIIGMFACVLAAISLIKRSKL